MSPLQHLDGGVGWLESRGDVSWTPGTNNTGGGRGNGLFQSASNSTTQMIINEFRFAAAKSIRTSTIILATFNVVAAFATAVGILFDTYCRKKRNDRNFRFRRNGFSFVPAAEVYPLVLSFGIVVQGITFAVAQSTGLDALVGLGCTLIAQMMLPAVFIVPYIQLIFGLEVAIRGLQKKEPFGQRGKWAVTICLTIIGLLILTNFLVANFDRAPNFCLTSLFWFVAHYSVGCFAVLTGIASILLVCTVVVFVRLHRSTKIEVTERVAASRMVYYMALAVISTGFMIPFFFSIAFIDQRSGSSNALTLSMIASVVANVSGLMTGGLYLFLKSNTLSTIGPKDKVTEYEKRRQKYKIRRYDPDNDDSYDDQIMNPVGGPGSLRRMGSEASLVYNKEAQMLDSSPKHELEGPPNPLRSNAVYPEQKTLKAPEPVKIAAAPTGGHMRKRSYSLFPNNAPANKSSITLLPATTYSPNNNVKDTSTSHLKPPTSMRNLMSRHRRDSSLVSTATVQIGLRLSSMVDIPPIAKNTVVVPDSNVYHLECPNLQKEKILSPNKRPAKVDMTSELRPSIARPDTVDGDTLVVDDTPKRDPVKSAKMKTLPPVPGPSGDESDYEADETAVESEVEVLETLSPKVYSPVKSNNNNKSTKLPSPRGVGFGLPSASKPGSGAELKSPPMIWRVGTGDTTPVVTEGKAWI